MIIAAEKPGTVGAPTAPPPPGPSGSTANRLRFTVARMARLLRQQDDSGFGPTVTAALATIATHGPLTLGELATREQVAPPSITKVVEKLVASDLVTREVDPNDRRSSLVRVTRQGRRHLDTSRTKKMEWLAARLASLDTDEHARLDAAMDVLEKLIAVPDRVQR